MTVTRDYDSHNLQICQIRMLICRSVRSADHPPPPPTSFCSGSILSISTPKVLHLAQGPDSCIQQQSQQLSFHTFPRCEQCPLPLSCSHCHPRPCTRYPSLLRVSLSPFATIPQFSVALARLKPEMMLKYARESSLTFCSPPCRFRPSPPLARDRFHCAYLPSLLVKLPPAQTSGVCSERILWRVLLPAATSRVLFHRTFSRSH